MNSPAFELPIQVRVEEGPEEHSFHYSGDSLLSIGRAEECDITLSTGRASRLHAEIFGEDGRFTLIDPGSSNGTKVNGETVTKHVLRPGDVITVGDARIVFGVVPETRSIAASPTAAPRRRSSAQGEVAGADVEGAHEEEAYEEGAEKPGAAAPGRTTYIKRKSPFAAVELLLSVLLVLMLGLLAREYLAAPPSPADSAANPATASPANGLVGNGSAGSAVSGGTVNGGGSNGAISPGGNVPSNPGAGIPTPPAPLTLHEIDALDTLALLEERVAAGMTREAALEDFAQLTEAYGGTAAAERAAQLVRVVEALSRTENSARRQKAEATLSSLVVRERYGDALTVARFLVRFENDGGERQHWRTRGKEIEAAAASRLRGVEDELSQLLEAGLGGEALRALIDVRDRFGGIEAYESVLPRYLAAGLGEVTPVARGRRAPPELIELDARATRAFQECRYADLIPILHRALGLDLPSDDRVRVLEELVEAHYLQEMWIDFVEGAAGGTVEIALGRKETGRLVRVTATEVEIEREQAGGSFREVKPWARVTPVQRFAIFSAVPMGRDATLGLAFLARRGGDPESFDRALVRLHRQSKGGEELATAVFARHRGEAVPEKGYLVHEGQLMTAAERTAAIARKKEQRAEEKAALARLKRLEKSEKVSDVVEWVQLLRGKGSFSLADRVLREVVSKTDAEMGVEARRLLDDPFLGSVPLRESGDPERRIDFFFLGDGYLVDDDNQTAFLNAARTCERLLFSVDPYREYQSYFNATAIHLQSKDSGIDRLPGGVDKDTACDAKVEWSRLSCNPEKVFSYLRRFPEAMAKDHQGIVIVNDYADVATGGGGVATLSKAGLVLVQHEVGHAFGALRDEYDYTPGTDPDRPMPGGRKGNVPLSEMPPNLMAGSDREAVLRETIWRNWIDAGEAAWWNNSKVSVFEGGNYTPYEVWRPQMGCMMRDNSGFCVVCMEQMVKQIYRRVRPIDQLTPEPGEIELGPKDEMVFQVLPMQPRTHELEVEWRLVSLGINKPRAKDDDDDSGTSVAETEGEVFRRSGKRTDVDGRAIHGAEMRAKDLDPGWYRLKVVVRDPTPWVLEDPDELLTDRAEWLIEVVGEDE